MLQSVYKGKLILFLCILAYLLKLVVITELLSVVN